MTLATNARIAGITSLVYLAAGLTALGAGRSPLANTMELFTSLSAVVLGVTLYAITRDQDRDLALLALACRAIEAVPGNEGFFFFAVGNTVFCWLLLKGRLIPVPMASLGLLGSALLLITLPLQRAGLLTAVDFLTRATWLTWLPLFVFEVALGVWLIVRGVAAPAATRAQAA